MATDMDRKNIPLTRYAIERATQQERMLYGPLIAELRKERGLTQERLSEMADVTSRTIRSIETGEGAGQPSKLIRLLIALDVDLDGTLWTADVHRYTAMIAPLIRDIHPDHRLSAVAEVLPILARAVGANPNVGGRYEHQDLPTLDAQRERKLRSEADRMAAERGDNAADTPPIED